MSKFRIAALLAASLLGMGQAYAAVDVVQAPTGHFVPDDSLKNDPAYWLGFGKDWGWTHGALTGFTSGTGVLSVSAFDVDFDQGEVDEIWAKDDGVWTKLGVLAGSNQTWDYTNFALGANFDNDIAAGLDVMIKIDVVSQGSWLVTLGKSSLTVDGSAPPPPVPGIPEPETYALMLAGLAAVGTIARRRQLK